MYDHFNNKYEKAMEERTNTLCSLTNFNPATDEASDFVAQYKETAIYKGTCYIFDQGTYVSSVPLEGTDIDKTLASEAAGGEIPNANPQPRVCSSSPESESKKEESLTESKTPADSERDRDNPASKKKPKKLGLFKKHSKSHTDDKEEHFESFLDHLDDTENIL